MCAVATCSHTLSDWWGPQPHIFPTAQTIDHSRPGLLCALFVGALRPGIIYGHMRMDTDLWQCSVMVTLWCCPSEGPGYQHQVLISHSVRLSWPWKSNSFPILIMPSTLLGRDKYQFMRYWFDWTDNRTPDLLHPRPTLYRFGHSARPGGSKAAVGEGFYCIGSVTSVRKLYVLFEIKSPNVMTTFW